MMMLKHLRRNERGMGAVEFALVAPVLISFIIGISQLGKMFFANADIKNAAAAGARIAAVWPVPDDPTILAAVRARLVGTEASSRATPTIVHGTENGNPYIEIQMSYAVPLDFIFFQVPPVTLHDTRRVFTQVTNANTTTYSGSTSASTTSASTTSSAGTTSASTSSAGTTSASTSASTSATSAGGTSASSTSTSSTSTSASTSASTSSTSSTTSSSGNASSGNASSSTTSSTSTGGHAHGNCRRC